MQSECLQTVVGDCYHRNENNIWVFKAAGQLLIPTRRNTFLALEVVREINEWSKKYLGAANKTQNKQKYK